MLVKFCCGTRAKLFLPFLRKAYFIIVGVFVSKAILPWSKYETIIKPLVVETQAVLLFGDKI